MLHKPNMTLLFRTDWRTTAVIHEKEFFGEPAANAQLMMSLPSVGEWMDLLVMLGYA